MPDALVSLLTSLLVAFNQDEYSFNCFSWYSLTLSQMQAGWIPSSTNSNDYDSCAGLLVAAGWNLAHPKSKAYTCAHIYPLHDCGSTMCSGCKVQSDVDKWGNWWMHREMAHSYIELIWSQCRVSNNKIKWGTKIKWEKNEDYELKIERKWLSWVMVDLGFIPDYNRVFDCYHGI